MRRAPRGPGEFRWVPERGEVDPAVVDSADAVINSPAHPPAVLPWTPGYKRTILRSRVSAATTLTEAMGRAASPPEVLLNASAVGYYGDQPGERLTEEASKGSGFSRGRGSRVGAGHPASLRGRARGQPRTGLVVGQRQVHSPCCDPSRRSGRGHGLGSGGQHWPWISLYDEAAAIRHLLTSRLSGPVNLAGPAPATADHVTRALAKRMGRWYVLRVPAWAIKVLGDYGRDLLLASQKQVPGEAAR